MPKPFTIAIEVEEVALGAIMRKLNTMPGIVSLHMDFDKPVKPNGSRAPAAEAAPKKRGPGRPPGPAKTAFKESGLDFVIKLLKARKTMSVKQLRDAFEAHGRAPTSLNSLLWNLQNDGVITRVDVGTYALKKKTRKVKSPKKETATQTAGA